MMKNNITLKNIVSNIILQVVTIISGFIIPRIILINLGSDVNGLVASLNQFLNYITLLEGGVSSVILANLYKPLILNDNQKLSSVVVTTKGFFKKISYIFLIYSFILSLVFPILTNTVFSFSYIFLLTLILSITLFVQYNFAITYRLLLQADKKVYIVSIIQTIFIIINTISFIVISKIYPSIHIMKIISGLIYIIQPVIFKKVVDKYYVLDLEVKPDTKLLKSRWNGFGINMAFFIHNNTDITLLTLFTNLKLVSVYSVYSMVIVAIKKIVQSISQAIIPTVAHAYARGDLEELNSKFDLYEYIMFVITYFIFTVAGLLITPFVLIYTSDVIDTNYYQPLFGVIIMLAEFIYCIREPYVALAYSADKFKDIKHSAYIEVILNIVISVILVLKLGLVGVAIGTLIAMTYRTIYHVFYLKNHILNRDIAQFLKKIISFSLVSIIGLIISIKFFPIREYTILNFIINGFIYSIIMLILLFIISIIKYKNELRMIKDNLIKEELK